MADQPLSMAQSVINALRAQRDTAMDDAAQARGMVMIQGQQIEALQARIAELEAGKAAEGEASPAPAPAV